MAAFIVGRLVQAFVVMAVVAALAFSMFSYVGDPVASMVGPEISAEQRAALRIELGLDKSLPVRFARFLGNAVQGDFGISYRTATPVGALIFSRLPATIELAVVGMALAILLGVTFGIYAGLHPRRWTSRLLMNISLLGVSLPIFITGILLIVVFSVWLGWLPSFGRGDVVLLGSWPTGLLTASGLKSLVLPALTIGLFNMALVLRLMRGEMMEILRTDYIKFARARGLTNRRVHFGHALRNALVPIVTVSGLHLGATIAFAIVTESLFQWPGVGALLLDAINAADIPVMSAYLLLVALLFVIINLAVDLTYFAVDPRMRADLNAKAA
jgi:peptide/nickel transport system permease protein